MGQSVAPQQHDAARQVDDADSENHPPRPLAEADIGHAFEHLRGDRVVVKTRSGEVVDKELKRRTAKSIDLRALNPAQAERSLSVDDVLWIARIVWASQ